MKWLRCNGVMCEIWLTFWFGFGTGWGDYVEWTLRILFTKIDQVTAKRMQPLKCRSYRLIDANDWSIWSENTCNREWESREISCLHEVTIHLFDSYCNEVIVIISIVIIGIMQEMNFNILIIVSVAVNELADLSEVFRSTSSRRGCGTSRRIKVVLIGCPCVYRLHNQ